MVLSENCVLTWKKQDRKTWTQNRPLRYIQVIFVEGDHGKHSVIYHAGKRDTITTFKQDEMMTVSRAALRFKT